MTLRDCRFRASAKGFHQLSAAIGGANRTCRPGRSFVHHVFGFWLFLTRSWVAPPDAEVRDNGFDSCDIRHLRKLKYYFQAQKPVRD